MFRAWTLPDVLHRRGSPCRRSSNRESPVLARRSVEFCPHPPSGMARGGIGVAPGARISCQTAVMTISPTDLSHLRRCVELATEALEDGDEPFGSILVDAHGSVRFEDRNRVK